MEQTLVDIGGKPMIQHVYERVRLCQQVSDVIAATDDARIRDVVTGFDRFLLSRNYPCAL